MASFSLDITRVPQVRNITDIPANDYAEFSEAVTGLNPGDVISQAAFTAKQKKTDSDGASTTVQRIVSAVSSASGVIVGNTPTFKFSPADTAKMLSANTFDVQIWVTRGPDVFVRTILIGTIRAVQDVTNMTGLVGAPNNILITGPALSGVVGDSRQLVGTVRDSSNAPIVGVSVAWVSSNPLVATVDTTGLVRFWSNGTCSITASNATYGLSNFANVTVANTGFVASTEGSVPTFRSGQFVPENPDTRYYTKTQIDASLATLSGTGHTHNASQITAGTFAAGAFVFQSLLTVGNTLTVSSGGLIVSAGGFSLATSVGGTSRMRFGASGTIRVRDYGSGYIGFDSPNQAESAYTGLRFIGQSIWLSAVDGVFVGATDTGGAETLRVNGPIRINNVLVVDNVGGAINDPSYILLRRNNVNKWLIGNNISLGADKFELWSNAAGSVLSVDQTSGAAAFSGTLSAGGLKAVINTAIGRPQYGLSAIPASGGGNCIQFGHSNSAYQGVIGSDNNIGSLAIAFYAYHSTTNDVWARSGSVNGPSRIVATVADSNSTIRFQRANIGATDSNITWADMFTVSSTGITANGGIIFVNSDSDAAFAVGNGGSGPTANRSAILSVNAPSSGSFPGASFTAYKRNNTTLWYTGIRETFTHASTAITDYVWYDVSTSKSLAALSQSTGSFRIIGDYVALNTKAYSSLNAAGSSVVPLISLGADDYITLGGNGTNPVRLGKRTNGTLNVGSSALDGTVIVDSTNNRLVYYSGGSRYYLPIGTAF